MKRNLDHRVETVAPVCDPTLQEELRAILDVYDADNTSAWDLRTDGTYARRTPSEGDSGRSAQAVLESLAHGGAAPEHDAESEDEATA
jgi:polyphosphate kinase